MQTIARPPSSAEQEKSHYLEHGSPLGWLFLLQDMQCFSLSSGSGIFNDVTHAAFLCSLLSSPTASLQHSVGDLEPYTEYEMRVVASNGYGNAYSNWTSMSTAEDSKQSDLV